MNRELSSGLLTICYSLAGRHCHISWLHRDVSESVLAMASTAGGPNLDWQAMAIALVEYELRADRLLKTPELRASDGVT